MDDDNIKISCSSIFDDDDADSIFNDTHIDTLETEELRINLLRRFQY